jgi:hypothetical protein
MKVESRSIEAVSTLLDSLDAVLITRSLIESCNIKDIIPAFVKHETPFNSSILFSIFQFR